MKTKLIGLMSVSLLSMPTLGSAGSVSLTTLGAAYDQNFDTLANSGASSSLPDGWSISETGSSANANGQYTASDGSSNAGDMYSYGSTGSTDRALGALRSGTLTPAFGASFTNNTGSSIESLAIAYLGEQWRAGVSSRGAADRLDFQLSTDATGLRTGTWSDYDSLDFSSPNISASAGPLVGNASVNRTALSYLISGLNIANGASFWIRWTDYDISSSDDGLGVDDFSIIARGGTTPPPSPVPEPGSLALLGLGLAGLGLSRRRKTQ